MRAVPGAVGIPSAFLAAALVGLYSCYGFFEACADVAEETPRPEETIPVPCA